MADCPIEVVIHDLESDQRMVLDPCRDDCGEVIRCVLSQREGGHEGCDSLDDRSGYDYVWW